MSTKKDSTWIIIRNEDWKILFSRKISSSLYSIPWWKFDIWETSLECALRELEEETWIKLETLEIFSHNENFHSGFDWREYIYIADVKNDIKFWNPEPHKFEWWKFLDISELDYKEVESYEYKVLDQLKGLIPINEKFSDE